jgi:protein-tyrosine-phosphatase
MTSTAWSRVVTQRTGSSGQSCPLLVTVPVSGVGRPFADAQVLTERGLDVSKEFPKPLTDQAAHAADILITMGCGDACPVYPGKRYLDWDLTDPAGKGVDAVRPIVDEIERRALELLHELGVDTDASA